MNIFHQSCLGLSIALAFLVGGIAVTYARYPSPPMYIKEEVAESGVTMVTIDGIRNGALMGAVQGNVRLIAGDHIVVPTADGSFAIADTKLLTNHVIIEIPLGMHFVASNRGKKFYPVTSADAQRIVPANRVYFPDEISAKKAGFVR